jgi:hypothetical protein
VDQATGRITVTQKKTLDTITVRLRPATLERLSFEPREREMLFPWCHSASTLTNSFGAIARAAKISSGSLKYLRRSGATLLEAERPGTAQHHLGHRTPGLAQRNYIDPRLAYVDRPLPPALDDVAASAAIAAASLERLARPTAVEIPLEIPTASGAFTLDVGTWRRGDG